MTTPTIQKTIVAIALTCSPWGGPALLSADEPAANTRRPTPVVRIAPSGEARSQAENARKPIVVKSEPPATLGTGSSANRQETPSVLRESAEGLSAPRQSDPTLPETQGRLNGPEPAPAEQRLRPEEAPRQEAPSQEADPQTSQTVEAPSPTALGQMSSPDPQRLDLYAAPPIPLKTKRKGLAEDHGSRTESLQAALERLKQEREAVSTPDVRVAENVSLAPQFPLPEDNPSPSPEVPTPNAIAGDLEAHRTTLPTIVPEHESTRFGNPLRDPEENVGSPKVARWQDPSASRPSPVVSAAARPEMVENHFVQDPSPNRPLEPKAQGAMETWRPEFAAWAAPPEDPAVQEFSFEVERSVPNTTHNPYVTQAVTKAVDSPSTSDRAELQPETVRQSITPRTESETNVPAASSGEIVTNDTANEVEPNDTWVLKPRTIEADPAEGTQAATAESPAEDAEDPPVSVGPPTLVIPSSPRGLVRPSRTTRSEGLPLATPRSRETGNAEKPSPRVQPATVRPIQPKPVIRPGTKTPVQPQAEFRRSTTELPGNEEVRPVTYFAEER